MKKKKTGKIVLIVIGVLLFAGVAGGLIFSANVGKQVADGLLYMNAENDTKENSVKHLKQRKYDLEGFEKTYLELSENQIIEAEDGNSVPAQIFTCPGSKNTVVLVHGQGGDHVVNYPMAELYLKHNWNVINFDQRGAGDNEDQKVTFGYYESRDVKALVEYAEKEMHSEQIVVHGQSMGAATAVIYAASEHAQKMIDAVVLDSCFKSMEDMFLGVWREMDGTEGIPEDYIIACGDWYLKKNYNFGFEDANICEILKKDQISTLMLQMERDELIPMEDAKEMYENIAAENKEIYYFDSEHIDGIIDYPKEYEERVFSFLSK